MAWLIRLGAYALGGFVIWQFAQGAGAEVSFPVAKRLVLEPGSGMVFGVCAGLASYTGIDVTLIRLGWVMAALYRGVGLAFYVLTFLLMPY